MSAPLHVRAHRAATAVLAPHLGEERARERAAQFTSCFDPLDLPQEAEIAAIILDAGLPCYGGYAIEEMEAESLAARVVLALESVR